MDGWSGSVWGTCWHMQGHRQLFFWSSLKWDLFLRAILGRVPDCTHPQSRQLPLRALIPALGRWWPFHLLPQPRHSCVHLLPLLMLCSCWECMTFQEQFTKSSRTAR